jgi:hypothetical protein
MKTSLCVHKSNLGNLGLPKFDSSTWIVVFTHSDQNEDDNEGQLNIDSELETIAEVVNDTLPSSDVVSTINISEEEEEQVW